jgi:hypothetical protein
MILSLRQKTDKFNKNKDKFNPFNKELRLEIQKLLDSEIVNILLQAKQVWDKIV